MSTLVLYMSNPPVVSFYAAVVFALFLLPACKIRYPAIRITIPLTPIPAAVAADICSSARNGSFSVTAS